MVSVAVKEELIVYLDKLQVSLLTMRLKTFSIGH